MNSTDKELEEWMKYGKNAFRRVPQASKILVPKQKVKVVKRQTSIEGQIFEYDKVISY